MDSLKITFEIKGNDLKHFQKLLREAKSAARALGEDEICARAEKLLDTVREAKAPAFIVERLQAMDDMLAMVRDEEFAMEPALRKPVVTALAYFADPEDLIPDHVPGLGFLDDAIMIELAVRELGDELATYREFCRIRDDFRATRGKGAKLDRVAYLAEKRRRLFDRLKERRRRAARGRTSGGIRTRFGLF